MRKKTHNVIRNILNFGVRLAKYLLVLLNAMISIEDLSSSCILKIKLNDNLIIIINQFISYIQNYRILVNAFELFRSFTQE